MYSEDQFTVTLKRRYYKHRHTDDDLKLTETRTSVHLMLMDVQQKLVGFKTHILERKSDTVT